MTGWAITGTAMRTAVGADREACFKAFCEGRSGVGPLAVFERSHFKAKHGYEIDDRGVPPVDRGGRASAWLTEVVSAALAESKLDSPPRTLPVLVGTGLRELRSMELWWRGESAFDLPELDFGTVLRRSISSVGDVQTLCNACSASSFALGLAEDLLSTGEAEAVIVAGADSITETMHGLADRANPSEAPKRLRPFDQDRKGVVLGEGAAALVLEPIERAEARGIEPRAYLRGVGMNCDGFHETAPSQAGVAKSMRLAQAEAGIGPEDIDLLMAHATGTALNDETEVAAFLEVFGARAPAVPITGLKSMTGHTSGPSGLIGVITAIESMRESTITPTVGLETIFERGQGLDFVRAPRSAELQVAQVDAFGFGGVNAVAIVGRSKP